MSRRNEVQRYVPPDVLDEAIRRLEQQRDIQRYKPTYYPPQQYDPPRPPARYRPPKRKGESGGQVIKNGFVMFLGSWIFCGLGWPGLTLLCWAGIAYYWMDHILKGKRR